MKIIIAKSRIVSIFILCAVIVEPLFAWNNTGHMTVAELAWRSLSAAKRTAISNLLKQHPHYALLLATNVPPGVDTNEWVFLKAATWPDMVRPNFGSAHPKPPEVIKFHHEKWHYINLPFIAPSESGQVFNTNFSATNILWAFSNAVSVLKDPHASQPDKAVSLCWVLHLVGDVHQPLHTTMLFSTNYPKGDGGGNALAVAEPGNKPVKLHAFWDDLLGGGESFTFIDTLASGLDKGSPYDPGKTKEFKKDKTFASWADESFSAAQAFAYLDGELKFADGNDYFSNKITAADVPALSTAYVANAGDIAHRRVALAGRRLAEVLKKLF